MTEMGHQTSESSQHFWERHRFFYTKLQGVAEAWHPLPFKDLSCKDDV